jgi:hypothetical protein
VRSAGSGYRGVCGWETAGSPGRGARCLTSKRLLSVYYGVNIGVKLHTEVVLAVSLF